LFLHTLLAGPSGGGRSKLACRGCQSTRPAARLLSDSGSPACCMGDALAPRSTPLERSPPLQKDQWPPLVMWQAARVQRAIPLRINPNRERDERAVKACRGGRRNYTVSPLVGQ